ncbi:hypothetical protein H8S90_05095 [Olivibacter sp. SDN3]|uniref:hypothetical protein n=1 Tax=Olivibacter sp. SDN3 TaxID=2764720 RepID=UPI0016517656|nr:hypothetical protein [Olivibacter sp. SDN3]QNL50969.1 hypothetical protein H8S90_05095 [Olivibacter sp. SDN3]
MKPRTLTSSYAGMLTQVEMNRWYAFMRQRIFFKYSKEELSFLMGKAPYYYSDYEEMNNAEKLTVADEALLNNIFNYRISQGIPFSKDEFSSYTEPRLVRVHTETDQRVIYYKITHPWKCENKFQVIRFSEAIPKIKLNEQRQAYGMLKKSIEQLIYRGTFQHGQSPLDVFRKLEEESFNDVSIRPMYAKKVLYEFVGKGMLAVKNINGLLSYLVS